MLACWRRTTTCARKAARAAFGIEGDLLIFAARRDGKRLTHIFLRDAKQALVSGPQAIEPFNGKHTVSGRIQNLGLGDRQVKTGRKHHAEVLVFDAARWRTSMYCEPRPLSDPYLAWQACMMQMGHS